jgi:phosphatidylserine/phosphatidylglycerophosphate/cardiolipin synthase-like enzyme
MQEVADDLFAELGTADARKQAAAQFPAYDVNKAQDRNEVVTASTVRSFRLGTGASIFTRQLIPAILAARSEVILVTCFWARSETLDALSEALTALAANRSTTPDTSILRVRICLSSRSLMQKLLHTQSRRGNVYPPSTWQSQLGLPDDAVLRAGRIDLVVKSLFFLPFSVVHPKLLIIDRERAFLPSCNVSWEAWLEGCVELAGDAVGGLLDFYRRVWEPEATSAPEALLSGSQQAVGVGQSGVTKLSPPGTFCSTADVLLQFTDKEQTPTIILPSSHHQNPRFSPPTWMGGSFPPPPPTPLNVALLHLLSTARQEIYIQTPDLTSPPVLACLLEAVDRGVYVDIVTCDNIKPWEQILTALTTTRRCAQGLISDYRQRRLKREQRLYDLEAQDGGDGAGGRLRIAYFHARRPAQSAPMPGTVAETGTENPEQSHLKLTIVDSEYTVLGSGNMDRASWYTSQELGILFQSNNFAAQVRQAVDKVMTGRYDVIFDSADEP